MLNSLATLMGFEGCFQCWDFWLINPWVEWPRWLGSELESSSTSCLPCYALTPQCSGLGSAVSQAGLIMHLLSLLVCSAVPNFRAFLGIELLQNNFLVFSSRESSFCCGLHSLSQLLQHPLGVEMERLLLEQCVLVHCTVLPQGPSGYKQLQY